MNIVDFSPTGNRRKVAQLIDETQIPRSLKVSRSKPMIIVLRSNIFRFFTVLLCSGLMLIASAHGRDFTRETRGIPLSINGNSIDIPFNGGFNQPRPYLLDIDGDGLLDMVIGDVNARLHYFKNSGTKEQPIWDEIPHPISEIDIGTWFCFGDIDADNDPDLFCDSRSGSVRLWRHERDAGISEFLLKSDEFGGFVAGPYSSPDFADLDGDNDLDFFYGGIGGNLLFHRNIGDPQFPVYEFVTDFYDSITAVPGGSSAPESGGSDADVSKAAQHGFSTIRFADFDSDGDQDLFWGDINNRSLYCFTNQGGEFVSDLTFVTDDYLPTTTSGFNHSSLADIDNDGDRDLIVGVGQNQDRENLLVYPNTGTPFNMSLGSPVSLLEVMDFGSNATVAIADLDGDSDQDFIMGSAAGKLIYAENIGTAAQPSYAIDTTRLAGLNVGFYTHPELVDYDGDGDFDLFVGNLIGRVSHWRNDGGVNSFQPVLVTSQFANLKVDQLANISFVDMDDDNRLDLVIGEWDFNGFANVLLYRNTGTVSVPAYTLIHTALLPRTLREYTAVTVHDYDRNGRLDLLVGGQNTGMQWWRNTTSYGDLPDSTTLVLMPDTLAWDGQGFRMLAEFADLDGDGSEDALIAEDDGGLNFYRSETSCCHLMGNLDDDPLKTADLIDLTILVDHLFISFAPLVCPAEANLDGDGLGEVSLVDLTVFVDNLFISFRSLTGCRD